MPELKQLHFTRTRQPKSKVWDELLNNPFLAIRELNNRSFYSFLKFFWPEVSSDTYEENWHVPYLCNELQEVAEQTAKKEKKKHDLIINIPPGTTKTITTSIMFPAWCWTRWHWMRFITLSYSQTLSLESAEFSRDLIRSDRFKTIYPELELKQDKDTKGNFRVVRKEMTGKGREFRVIQGGNRYSTSVGGTLTGFHGHIIIVDDPLNPQQAVSEVELKNSNRWLDQTLPTRKVNKAVTPTITIMQRLHEDDPTGHALAKQKTNIRHICLPGELQAYKDQVKPADLIKHYKNNLLDPRRLDWEVLKDLEKDLGQYGYSGQIGQRPTPPQGGMFKVDNITVADRIPGENQILKKVRYWDKAGSEGTGAYTVGWKMYELISGRYLIVDIKRGQWSSEVRESIIKATAETDGRDVKVYVEQEPGSGGKESAENTIRRLAGYACYADRPTGDKVHRADTFSVAVNNGDVMMLRADWNTAMIDEMRNFPFGKYKDQVDAGSGSYQMLVGKKSVKLYNRNRKK